MSLVTLITLLSLLNNSKSSKFYARYARPEVPQEFFHNPFHQQTHNINHHQSKDDSVLTAHDVFSRHMKQFGRFPQHGGLKMKTNKKNRFAGPNHYYKGDNVKTWSNKIKRWYRQPLFPNKGKQPSYYKKPTNNPILVSTTTIKSTTTLQPSIPTVLPVVSMTPTLVPSISPIIKNGCNFNGIFSFSGESFDINVTICDNNGKYNVGFSKFNRTGGTSFTFAVGKGTVTDTTLFIRYIELKARTSVSIPCFLNITTSIECTVNTTTNTSSYIINDISGKKQLTRLSFKPNNKCFNSPNNINWSNITNISKQYY